MKRGTVANATIVCLLAALPIGFAAMVGSILHTISLTGNQVQARSIAASYLPDEMDRIYVEVDLYQNDPFTAPFYLDIDDDEDIRVGTETIQARADVSFAPLTPGSRYCSDHYWETTRDGAITEIFAANRCANAPSPPEECPEGPDPEAPEMGEEGEEECDDSPPSSPILLDLDRNQFHLSGGPVYFDIDADGQPENLTWVSPGAQDAFLFLDRNGNGVVDDGSELFGNATFLISGERAKHGYEALEEFDLFENGGNQDGVIDDADSIYSILEVWIDSNANGNHESLESRSLAEADVLTIGLNYRESRRTDSHGNQFRYIGTGLIEVNGHALNMATTDVFFKILAQ